MCTICYELQQPPAYLANEKRAGIDHAVMRVSAEKEWLKGETENWGWLCDTYHVISCFCFVAAWRSCFCQSSFLLSAFMNFVFVFWVREDALLLLNI